MNNAQKAYEAFKTITSSPYDRTNTAKLNILYTIVCKAEKDGEYKKELESFILPDGSGMNVLEAIDTFFNEFNNSHGLDIRLSLSPFDNPDYPDGLYFVVRTYKKLGEKTVECAPFDYRAGEEAILRAILFNQVTDKETVVPLIKCYACSEDGTEISDEVKNSSSAELRVTCKRAGSVRARFVACDSAGKQISGSEEALPGAVFDFTEIKTTNPTPDDLEAFWKGEVERLKKTRPDDKEVTLYNGSVAYDKDVVKTNYYHIKKADKAYIEMLRSKRIATTSNSMLDSFDLWEFSLKCPGPCPSTGYISIPKNANPLSLPLRFIYAGYGAHAPQPFFAEDAIFVYSTHHGYPCALSDEECYNDLNGKGVLGSYGKGNGAVNSLFENMHDCYSLYIHLRNLQALIFVANPEFSRDIPEIARMWNGEATFEGSSLGGYQTIAMCALAKYIDEKVKVTMGTASVPAFCNYAGPDDNRLSNTFDIHWCENAEYFDGAHLATLIDTPMNIDRNSFGDSTCVSSSICMAYNNFKGPKEIHFMQNSSHGYRPKTESQLWYVHKA